MGGGGIGCIAIAGFMMRTMTNKGERTCRDCWISDENYDLHNIYKKEWQGLKN